MAESRSGDLRERSPKINPRRWTWIALAALPTATALCQADSVAVPLSPVVVTVTRTTERPVLRSPFAISIINPDSTRYGRRSDLDRLLTLTPGLGAATRNNPSQDPRISIRGFGSRSAFGVRGVRVMRDGIPLTLPDGQTPVDYLSVVSVGRIEILRGSASALYGNASGGVIDFRTAPPSPHPISGEASEWIGPDSYRRTVIAGSGTRGRLTYTADAAALATDGDRAHSRQRSVIAFARSALAIGRSELSVTAMGLHTPVAENPGALTLAELRADSRAADPLSVRRDARKAVKQLQLGSAFLRPLANGRLAISGFGGVRALENPLTFAIVDVDRTSYGASALINHRLVLGRFQHSVTTGIDLQGQRDWRDNHVTCIDTLAVPLSASCPDPGRDRGKLLLRQREEIASAGGYLSDDIEFGNRVTVSLGVRADAFSFRVADRLVTSTNPDDSGHRRLSAVSPLVAAIARLGDNRSLYANFATAFETPTVTELGTQPDGSAGLNAGLDPQRARTIEGGIKGYSGNWLSYDLALFVTGVRNELIPFEIPGSNGRRYFRNAGRTNRRGAEFATGVSRGNAGLKVSYTLSSFRFREYFVGDSSLRGTAIPGIPLHRLQTALRVGKASFAIAEFEAASRSWVDDRNSVSARGFVVGHLRGGVPLGNRFPWATATLSLANIFDTVYSPSLAVNAARGRYYEPAPRRTLTAGLSIGPAGADS